MNTDIETDGILRRQAVRHRHDGIITAFDASSGKILWQKPGTSPVPMLTTHAICRWSIGLVIFHVGGHDQGALTASWTIRGTRTTTTDSGAFNDSLAGASPVDSQHV